MHGERADAPVAQPPVECDGVQDVGGLCRAVCGELVIGAVLPVGVIQIDVTETVPLRGQVDDAGARDELPPQQDGERKMAQMVCPELRFESVVGAAERGEHHPGVVHQHLDDRGDIGDLRCRGLNARQRGEVDHDGGQPRSGLIRLNRVAGLPERGGIARRQHHVRARRRQGPGGLPAQSRRGSGDHTRLAAHTHRCPPSTITPAVFSIGLMTEVKSDSGPSARSVCSQMRCTVSAISTGRPRVVASSR